MVLIFCILSEKNKFAVSFLKQVVGGDNSEIFTKISHLKLRYDTDFLKIGQVRNELRQSYIHLCAGVRKSNSPFKIKA